MKNKWNLKPLYDSDNDPQIQKDIKTCQRKVTKFADKWRKDSSYLTNPSKLLSLLDENERMIANNEFLSKPSLYYFLRLSQKQDDPKLKAEYNKLHSIAVELENKSQFIMINISKIPKDSQKKFLSYKPLFKYKHFLEKTFESGRYTLTDSEEKILNITGKMAFDNWTDMIDELLGKEVVTKGKKTYALTQLSSLCTSAKQSERDFAGHNLNMIFKKHSDVAERELNTILEYKYEMDKLRGYEYPQQGRFIDDDIDKEVVESMVRAVTDNFSISQEIYKLVASKLGKKKIRYYERSVNFFSSEKKFPFSLSSNITKEIFSKYDKEIGSIASRIIDNNQVDVFPYKGKAGGAFCVNEAKLPVYILQNHTNRFYDVTTLAHEMGHAVNDELAKKSQNQLNDRTPTSMAEVASTFFEDFAFNKASELFSSKEIENLYLNKLLDEVGTIFRQVACYNFECELHKTFRRKGYFSKEEIGKIFLKNMKAYLGDSVEFDEDSQYWWVYWSHIRRFFYVYSYSSGLLIAKALQKRVRENPEYMKKVKILLSAGNIKSPKDILKDIGLDITQKEFWESGLEEVKDLLLKAMT